MGNALLSWRYNWFYQAGRRNNNSFRFFYYLTCISFGWYDYKSRQVPGINSSLLYSFLAGFGAGTPQQEAVPKGQEFSRIENLWPRDDSCSQLIRSKQLLRNCFQIVKTHKASKEPFSSEVVVFTVSTTTFLFCFSCKRVRNMVYRLYETLLRLNNLTFNDV